MPISSLPHLYCWFDIGSCFRVKPDLKVCPHCAALLLSKKTKPTSYANEEIKKYSIPHIATTIQYCIICHWWTLRETIFDLECSAALDEMIFPPIQEVSSPPHDDRSYLRAYLQNDTAAPWAMFYEISENKRQAIPISRKLAIGLFGEEVVAEKWG